MPNCLARRRRQLGLTVEEVATASGMSVEQVRGIEHGTWVPAPHQAPVLAQLLQLELEPISLWVVASLLRRPGLLVTHVRRCNGC